MRDKPALPIVGDDLREQITDYRLDRRRVSGPRCPDHLPRDSAGKVAMPQGLAVLDLVLGDRFDARAGRIDGMVALAFENLLLGLTKGFAESRIGIDHRFLGTVVGRMPDGE